MAGLNPRMRLTIDVLPLTEENSHGPGQYRDLALAALKGRKFALPVQSDQTFEQVWAQIEERYKRNYLQPHEASCFTIKKLQDAYECDLDLSDTVAAIYEGETDPQNRLIKVVPSFVYREFSVPFTSNLRPASAQKRHRELHGEHSSKRRRIEMQELAIYHDDQTQNQPVPSTESDRSNGDHTIGTHISRSRNSSRRSRSGFSVVYVQDSQTGQIEFAPLVKEESPELGQPPLRTAVAISDKTPLSPTREHRKEGSASVSSVAPLPASRESTELPLQEDEDQIMGDDAGTSKSPVSDTPDRQDSELSSAVSNKQNGARQTSSPEPFGKPTKQQKTYSRRQSLRTPASAQKERGLRDSSPQSSEVEEERGSAKFRSFKLFRAIDDEIVSTPQAKQGRSTGDRRTSPRVVIPTPKPNVTSKKTLSTLNSLVTGRAGSISNRTDSSTPARDDPSRSAKALQDFKQARGKPTPSIEPTTSYTSQSAASGTPRPTSMRSEVPLPENVRYRFSQAGSSSSASRKVSSPQPGLIRGASREESPFYAKKTLFMVNQGREPLVNGSSVPGEAAVNIDTVAPKAPTSSSLRKPSKKFFDMPRMESPVQKKLGRTPGSKSQRQKAKEQNIQSATPSNPATSSGGHPRNGTEPGPKLVEPSNSAISSSSAAPIARKSSQRSAIPLPENVRHRYAASRVVSSPSIQTSNIVAPIVARENYEHHLTQAAKGSPPPPPAGQLLEEPLVVASSESSSSSDDSNKRDQNEIDPETETEDRSEKAQDGGDQVHGEARAAEVSDESHVNEELADRNHEHMGECIPQNANDTNGGQSVVGADGSNEHTIISIDEDQAVLNQIRTESLPITTSQIKEGAGAGNEETLNRSQGALLDSHTPKDGNNAQAKVWSPQSWDFGTVGEQSGAAENPENVDPDHLSSKKYRSRSVTESNSGAEENPETQPESGDTSTRSSPAGSHKPARFLSRSPTSEKSMSEDDSPSQSPVPDKAESLEAANDQVAEDDSTTSDSSSTSSDDVDNGSKEDNVELSNAATSAEPNVIPPSSPPPIPSPVRRKVLSPPAPSSSMVPSTSQPLPRASQTTFSGTARYTPTPIQRTQPQSAVRSSQLLNGARRPTYQKYPNVKQQLLEERTRMKTAQKVKTFDPSTTSMGRLAKAKAKVDLSDGSDDDSSSTSSSSEDEVTRKRDSQNDAGCLVA